MCCDQADLNPEFLRRINLSDAAWRRDMGTVYRPVIVSIYRSVSKQQKLYDLYVADPTKHLPASPPGRSLHNFRPTCAADFEIRHCKDGPISRHARPDLYRKFGRICTRFGLAWGGDFRKPDVVHIQALGYTWNLAAKGVEPNWAPL